MLVALEDLLGAVAVVHVEIDDRDSVQTVRFDRVTRCDRDVVEDAEAHRARTAGVMARRANAAKSRLGLIR